MTRTVRTAVTTALLAAALPAAAFVRETTTPGSPGTGLCLWWRSRQIPYRVNATAAVNAQHPEATPCQSAAAAEASAAAGLAAWGSGASSCTDFSFVHGAPTTNKNVGRDGMNLVVFRNALCSDVVGTDTSCAAQPGGCAGKYNCWEDDNGGGTIALTTTSFDPETGELSDADIEVNGWDGNASPAEGFYLTCGAAGLPACATYGETGCNGTDVQAVVTHEAGHVLGLDHVCQYASPYDPGGACAADAVMVPDVGRVDQRPLATDDVAGACAIYPLGASTLTCLPGGGVPPATSAASGGCSSAAGTGALSLVALALVARRARRRGV